jgi:Rps23 Pro-64 3,4-dihydroxylase Tpa1-like proline 4-hydroxylase
VIHTALNYPVDCGKALIYYVGTSSRNYKASDYGGQLSYLPEQKKNSLFRHIAKRKISKNNSIGLVIYKIQKVPQI